MNLTFDFAFEGFRLIRERPKLIAFWGAITLFTHSVCWLVLISMAGPSLASFFKLIQSGNPDMAAIMGLNQQLAPAFMLYLAILTVMSSVISSAICRISRGETNESLGFLAFGMDEIRLIVVNLATLAILCGAAMGISACGLIIGDLIATASPAGGAAIRSLAIIAAVCLTVWLWLRLSLNGPHSFFTGKIDIFGSFSLTNERFWSLFTGYAVAFVLAEVVHFLCNKIIEAVQVLSLGLKVTGDMVVPDPTSLSSFLTPSSAIALSLTFAIVAPLMAAIRLGAPVAAYRQLKGAAALRKSEDAA